MCALKTAEYQQDHDEIARLVKPITLNEVSIFYRDDNQPYELILDPGEVRVVLWDPRAITRFPGAPSGPGSLNHDMNAPLHITPSNETHAFGVKTHVKFQRRDGSWDGFHNEVVVTHLVARYRGKEGTQSYELPLAVTSSLGKHQATVERTLSQNPDFDAYLESVGTGYFTETQISNGIDVLFWDDEACEAYRREFIKSDVLNRHRLFKPDGAAHSKQLDDVEVLYKTTLFMPKPLTRELTFHTVTCKLCYHYESCQWVCTGDAP